MSAIQAHHVNLWFAGTCKNWALANVELKEIMESIRDIKQYQTGRKETRSIGVIEPALDSVATAVAGKNDGMFKSSFVNLTNTCNNCHRANEFEFNVVKVPATQSFSNQDFTSTDSAIAKH